MPIEWDVAKKIIEFYALLSAENKFQLWVALIGSIAVLIGTVWQWGKSRGYRRGRKYELDHGQVPVLNGKLEDCRHRHLMLDQKVERRDEKILMLNQSALSNGDLSPELQALVDIRKKVVEDDAEIWGLRQAQPLPDIYQRLRASAPKIITIGNLKGGVGKTTLTANLAAHFDLVHKKRVLVIDLDYQGSVSSMMLQAARITEFSSVAEHLLNGTASGEWLVGNAKNLDAILPRTRLIPAGYTLQSAEDQLMARWLFHTVKTDVRFKLAEILLSGPVQERYDLIILDVGPRLTTASMSAICASTHLIVPTNLDNLAAETVSSFLRQVGRIKTDFGLPLEFAGVVGTMTYQNRPTKPEQDTIASIREGLKLVSTDPHIFERTIPRKTSIADVAGSEIAYLRSGQKGRDIRLLIDVLGHEIATRIKL